MAGKNVELFLEAKKVIRAHPDWTDEKVAVVAGLRPSELDLVRTARRDVEAG